MRLSLERVGLCLKHLSAAHSVFTLPLVGRVGAKRRGGGCAVIRRRTPTPSPSPQGGGEHTEFVARAHSTSHELALFALGIGAGPARDRGAGRERSRHAPCRGRAGL